jgi:hypothetical protein
MGYALCWCPPKRSSRLRPRHGVAAEFIILVPVVDGCPPQPGSHGQRFIDFITLEQLAGARVVAIGIVRWIHTQQGVIMLLDGALAGGGRGQPEPGFSARRRLECFDAEKFDFCPN